MVVGVGFAHDDKRWLLWGWASLMMAKDGCGGRLHSNNKHKKIRYMKE